MFYFQLRDTVKIETGKLNRFDLWFRIYKKMLRANGKYMRKISIYLGWFYLVIWM